MRAIADGVMEALAADGVEAGARRRLRPRPNGSCSTTSISSSTSSRRRPATFYGLERLWGNAERVRDSPRQRRVRLDAAARSAAPLRRAARRARWSSLLAPPCAACGEPLDHPTRGRSARPAGASILPLTPPLCDRCGDPLPSWRVDQLAAGACAALPTRVDVRRPRGPSAPTTARCARSSTR